MLSTYLTTGGREREQIVTEMWELLHQRLEAGSSLTLADLDQAIERICPRWEESHRSLAVALLARSYSAILAAVGSIAESRGAVVANPDLTALLKAYDARVAIECNLLGIPQS